MTVPPQQRPVNASLAPPPVTPSRRDAHVGLPPDLFAARGPRIRYRLVLLWTDSATRSGTREEVVEFTNPRRLCDLMRRIASTPARPLLSFRLRALARPVWRDVTPAFVAWRCDEAERRERERGAR